MTGNTHPAGAARADRSARRRRSIRAIAVFAGLVAGMLAAASSALAQDAATTTGTVRGVVRDPATGEALIGVTVVASSPALQGIQAAITDERGEYRLPGLPPGDYTLTAYYGEVQVARPGIRMQLGQIMTVNLQVTTAGGEVVTIEGRTPVVDQGSTKSGVVITEDETRNLPTGRTFLDAARSVPGAEDDTYGISFSGSTSPENLYLIDGMNTTGVSFGLATTTLPNEFLQQIETVTGGYGAELGRSTGGIINALTKAGGNEIHGSVFSTVTPAGLRPGRRFLPSDGSAVTFQREAGTSWDVGGEVGGPILKDRLWFHAGLMPSFSTTNMQRVVSTQVDANADAAPDAGEGGFARSEELSRRVIGLDERTVYFTSKLSYAASSEHGGALSVFGNPTTREELIDDFAVGPDQTLMFDRSRGSVVGAASWTSRFFDRRTELHASAGYMAGWDVQEPKLAGGDEQSFRFTMQRSLQDFEQFEDVPAACSDGAGDPYPMIVNCPVINYQVGGVDFYSSDRTRRATAGVSASHFFDAGGSHLLAGGADFAENSGDSRRTFSGGTRWWLFDLGGGFEAPTRWHLVQPARNGDVPCGTDWDGDGVGDTACGHDANGFSANTRTRDIGLYLQDTYRPIAELAFEAGVRWDRQALGSADQIAGQLDPVSREPIAGDALVLHNLSPRIGAIYDWTGEGRSRVFTHWGRYYESIPLDLNARGFAGEVIDIAILDQTGDLTGSAGCGDPLQPASYDCDPAGTIGGFQIGGNRLVAPGTRSQYMDEIVLGAEYEVVRDLKIGVVGIHRGLGRALDDVSPDGGSTFVVANPGEVDEEAVRDLREQAMATDDPVTAARLDFLANAYEAVGAFDEASRTYQAIELSAVKFFSRSFMARASYTLSRLRGNYPGLFSPDTNQLDPNFTSMFDLPDLMANRHGPLPGDRPHAFKAEGYYRLALTEDDSVVLGARARGATGRPSGALGSHMSYGPGETFILPRGAGERTPFQSALDVHAAYGRRLGRGMAVEAFVNLFNALNQQTAVRRDEIYTFDVVRPVVGGDHEDLEHLKKAGAGGAVINEPVSVNPNYGNATDTQLPLAIQLGARLTF
jgi:hypothetical protein